MTKPKICGGCGSAHNPKGKLAFYDTSQGVRCGDCYHEVPPEPVAGPRYVVIACPDCAWQPIVLACPGCNGLRSVRVAENSIPVYAPPPKKPMFAPALPLDGVPPVRSPSTTEPLPWDGTTAGTVRILPLGTPTPVGTPTPGLLYETPMPGLLYETDGSPRLVE